jgi:DNA-directed RNA polymerase subunit omega
MARITVEDCLEKVDNQYDLVLLAKERTVQLNAGSPMLVEEDNDKRTIISLREIGDGKIDVKEIEASAIKRLRKEPDEIEQQEDTEEETNDDFENLYKGQVSKSGVAIYHQKEQEEYLKLKSLV